MNLFMRLPSGLNPGLLEIDECSPKSNRNDTSKKTINVSNFLQVTPLTLIACA